MKIPREIKTKDEIREMFQEQMASHNIPKLPYATNTKGDYEDIVTEYIFRAWVIGYISGWEGFALSLTGD